MTEAENRSAYILVAEDYSAEARAAAHAAIQIAANQNLALRGLYVVDEVLTLDTYADYHAELPISSRASNGDRREPTSRAELMRWFETQGEFALQWLETAGAEAGVTVTTRLLAGGVPELVLRNAAQAQLLAIGRREHGHTGNSKSLGHNFRNIAHHVHRPLLVGGKTRPSLHRLLLAYHGRAHADRALAWAARLQRHLTAEVIVLCVLENTEACQTGVSVEEIRTRLAQSDLNEYRFLTDQGRPAIEIAAVAAANEVDLIVMGHYRHAAPLEWLVGSTVDQLLQVTSLPVLIA